VVAHHRDCLLHEGRPGHGAVEHDVALLVHCAQDAGRKLSAC
jgi:hypothetical protein